MSKMILPSLDAVFRLVEIDPSLPNPDPAVTKEHHFVRLLPYTDKPSMLSDEPISMFSTYDTEYFVRDYLIDQDTGACLWFWRRRK